MKTTKLEQLLDEVEALLAVFLGREAEGESWLELLERFKRINKLLKAVRLQRRKEQNP